MGGLHTTPVMNVLHGEMLQIMSRDSYTTQIAACKANTRANRGTGPKVVNDFRIEFYGTERNGNNDTFGKWLSNCYRAPITIDGKTYPSSEHYYQMQKFVCAPDDPAILAWCDANVTHPAAYTGIISDVHDYMLTLSPVKVAEYGRTCRTVPLRSDWDAVKDHAMFEALNAKFTQNPTFADALCSTGERVLIERAPKDTYWGISNAGIGTNNLGVMLMIIRDSL